MNPLDEYWVMRMVVPPGGVVDDRTRALVASGDLWAAQDGAILSAEVLCGGSEDAMIKAQDGHARTGVEHRVVMVVAELRVPASFTSLRG